MTPNPAVNRTLRIKPRKAGSLERLDVMKQTFVVLALVMASSILEASDNVLAPCTSMPHGSRLRSLIMRGVDAEPLVTFTVIPSFEKEYGWALYRKKDAFVLRFVRFRTPVWSDPGWSKPRPEGAGWIERHMDVHERNVDDSFANQMFNLVEEELAVVEPRPDNEVKLDGVTYEVAKAGTCGEAWSPEPGSRMFEFVEMIEALENVASAWTESGGRKSQAKVGEQIEELRSRGSGE
ncbi:MAG: hypothetical protein IT475_13900 [Aquimonas sp.]|nr:hypothetical protein [Aquimonas sp.]